MLLILNSGDGYLCCLELHIVNCWCSCLELSIQWLVRKPSVSFQDLKDFPIPKSSHLLRDGKCLAVLSLGENYVCKCTYMCDKFCL